MFWAVNHSVLSIFPLQAPKREQSPEHRVGRESKKKKKEKSVQAIKKHPYLKKQNLPNGAICSLCWDATDAWA